MAAERDTEQERGLAQGAHAAWAHRRTRKYMPCAWVRVCVVGNKWPKPIPSAKHASVNSFSCLYRENMPPQPPPPHPACPTWTPAPNTHARTLRHLQASDARWGAEKNRAQSYTLGTQGVGGSAGGHRPFGGVPPPPQPRRRESGGDAPT
jgi:hypothetical protein